MELLDFGLEISHPRQVIPGNGWESVTHVVFDGKAPLTFAALFFRASQASKNSCEEGSSNESAVDTEHLPAGAPCAGAEADMDVQFCVCRKGADPGAHISATCPRARGGG